MVLCLSCLLTFSFDTTISSGASFRLDYAFMETSDWKKERDKLRDRFAREDITSTPRKELEGYLVVLANTPNPSHRDDPIYPKYETETKLFAAIIQHLLVVRIAEELHKKSHRISVWALRAALCSLAIALAAAVFAGLLVWVEDQKDHPRKDESPKTTMRTPSASLPLQSLPILAFDSLLLL